ncbi:Maf family protein [Engelhardtia mirabilis]|uniref:7-methyl-GTP pyrophosphatase n=1 Tax=Engelhardtia mirabilis TaxID=2528011 RepID=A0A518BEZ0_9BACT|nr:Maf-like protein YceF [Planctomycetes bacterium Pla133]QDU99875.1 Maf-like protein YceF [Planctomycetes bacterium Pla86]
MQIILASTSPYRRALLERLGLEFDCVAPDVDEDAYKSRGLEPRELAQTLARAKAASVAELYPEAVVIGSDQVCALDSEVLSKPGSPARAAAQLERLAGRTHRLVTAVAIQRGGERRAWTDVATLTMRALTRAAIERYVAVDDPVDCAGAYKLEQRGIALFEQIACDDHSAITGLPLIATVRILGDFGIDLP